MRRFGLILSLILILCSGVFAVCPINSSSIAVDMVIDSGRCDGLSLVMRSGTTYVDSLTIIGNVTLNNSDLYFDKTPGSYNIYINDTGWLDINFSNFTAVGPFSNPNKNNLTLILRPGGKLSINGFSVNFWDELNYKFYSDVNISNLSYSGFNVNPSEMLFSEVSDSYFTESNISLRNLIVNYSNNLNFTGIKFFAPSYVSVNNSVDITFDDSDFPAPLGYMWLENSSVSVFDLYDMNYSASENSSLNVFDAQGTLIVDLADTSSYSRYHGTDIYVLRSKVGSPLSGVVLNIFDVFNLTTAFDSGETDSQGHYLSYMLEYKENLTDIVYYSNYTINGSLSRYDLMNETYNATASRVIKLNMSSKKGIVKTGLDCLSSIPLTNFCVDENPKTDSSCENMVPGSTCQVVFIVNATDNGLTVNSSSLHWENISFFTISESNLPEVVVTESDLLNVTIIP